MDRKLITNLDTDENDDLSAVNMITMKKMLIMRQLQQQQQNLIYLVEQ